MQDRSFTNILGRLCFVNQQMYYTACSLYIGIPSLLLKKQRIKPSVLLLVCLLMQLGCWKVLHAYYKKRNCTGQKIVFIGFHPHFHSILMYCFRYLNMEGVEYGRCEVWGFLPYINR